ncbi:hypothetical protein [Methanobacterium formicicum]|uniref:Uncharacterized protein n=1 Tax=Methanobacterium formicicum (strain DSM 3637 / PP1) TaxID=1204725 RepID=K2RDV4_METFP|nr:hypothetical protein [Methanobacterium formicicum]EKF86529.1 hypothetical protein A994_03563 [Methanobacterium formicicum DSM 3637]
MRKEITLEMDPELLEKIESSPFKMEDLFDLACILSIETNSIIKLREIHQKKLKMKSKIRQEQNEIYHDLEKARKDKSLILNKYKGFYHNMPLFEAVVDENDPDLFIVEESEYSYRIDHVNFLIDSCLSEIQFMDKFDE